MWQLLILLLLANTPAFALDIRISPESSSIKVNTQAELAIDTSASLTFDQVQQLDFQSGYPSLNLGHTDVSAWLKLKIHNQLTNPKLILHINNPSLDSISLFQQSQGQWQTTELGDRREFHQRLLNLPAFAIPISVATESTELIYLRVQSKQALNIPLTIFSQDEFSHYLYSHYISFGMLYGIPMGLLLYNLLLFISARKRTHFLYCLVIIANTYVSLSWDGITYSLFPDSPYFQQRSFSLAMCLGIIALTLFAKSFLQTSTNTPKINSYLNGIAIIALLFSGLIFLPNSHIFYFPIIGLTMLMIPGLLAAGIFRAQQAYMPAKIYLLAISSFLLAVVICALSVLNILPLQEEITYIYKIGVISELILLSLGIAARLKALKLSEQAAIETLRKIEEDKLKSENQALAKANKLKDTFLSTISHELRTPMNGVKGALALLGTESDDQQRDELLSTINHSSDTMIELIERLLLFTELKGGKIKSNCSQFSLQDLIKSEYKHWQSASKNKSLQLKIQSSANDLIYSDPNHIQWILSELVDNAIKFSEEGKILISIDTDQNRSLLMTVCDQGKGLRSDLSEDLKDVFRQQEQDFSRQHGGLGLGLSIVAELVKLLSGHLTIKNSHDYSTCIKIEIPLEKAEVKYEPCSHAIPRDRSLPLNVLIIEDNPVNQMILNKMIKKLGHHTHLTNDGVEGYQAAKEREFDIILMDCQMPNMDGFECTHRIRNTDNPNSNTPIIAITANASDFDKENCLRAGMNDYRKKPIEPSTIQALLDTYFIHTETNKALK
jgi:signal transduction histidine kinase/ActR/RegA family two-component response regulator